MRLYNCHLKQVLINKTNGMNDFYKLYRSSDSCFWIFSPWPHENQIHVRLCSPAGHLFKSESWNSFRQATSCCVQLNPALRERDMLRLAPWKPPRDSFTLYTFQFKSLFYEERNKMKNGLYFRTKYQTNSTWSPFSLTHFLWCITVIRNILDFWLCALHCAPSL